VQWAGLILTIAATLTLGYFLSARPSDEGDKEDIVSTLWDSTQRFRDKIPFGYGRDVKKSGKGAASSEGEEGSDTTKDADDKARPALEPNQPIQPIQAVP
jgi:hypothetical protein